MFPETLETDSLVLKPLSPDHVGVFELYDLFAESTEHAADVFRYVPQEPFATPKDAHDWLRDAAGEWEAGSHAKYAVYEAGEPEADAHETGEPADGEPEDDRVESGWPGDEEVEAGGPGDDVVRSGNRLAGVAALSPKWDRRSADLAVILAKPFWGRGYAGECAAALAEVAFDRFDLELVALGYDEGNERSERAIETVVDRFGGQYDGLIRNATRRGCEVADAHRYTVTREEWWDAVGDP